MTLLSLALAAIALAVAPSIAHAELTSAGNVTSTRILPPSVEVTLDSGAVASVTAVEDGTVRVRFASSGTFSTFQTGATVSRSTSGVHSQVFDTADAVYIVTPSLIAGITKHPYGVDVWRADGSLVQADASPAVGWDRAS